METIPNLSARYCYYYLNISSQELREDVELPLIHKGLKLACGHIAEWAVHCMAQVFKGQFNLGINFINLQPDSKVNKQFPTVHIKAL